MDEKKKTAQEKLELLGEHLKEGWKNQYQLKEQFFSQVRESVREQWQQEQAKAREMHQEHEESKSQEREAGPEQEQDQDHDQEQSH